MKAFSFKRALFIATLLLLALLATGFFVALPKVIEKKLSAYGFPNASIGALRWPGGLSLQLEDLGLDEINTIKIVSASWQDGTVFLKLDGANLSFDKKRLAQITGDSSEADNEAVFPPFKAELLNISIFFQDYNSTLVLPALSISVENLQAIKAAGEFHAAFPGAFSDGRFEIKTPDTGGYEGFLEISKAEVESTRISSKSISGWARLQYEAGKPPAATAEFTAGTADIFAVPFRNVSLTFSTEQSQYKLALRGATPDENTKISLNTMAKPVNGGLMAFEGTLDIVAKDLEKLKKLAGNDKIDIAGSGQAKLGFSGSGDPSTKELAALSVSTTRPVNFKGRLSGNAVDIKNLSLKFDHTPESLKAHAEASTLALPALEKFLAPVSFSIDATGQPDSDILFTGRISDPNGAFVLNIEGAHGLTRNAGKATAKLGNIKFMPGLYQPHNISPFLKQYLQEVSGQMAANASFSWKKEKDVYSWNGTGSLLANNLSGNLNNVQAAGINGVIRFSKFMPITTEPDQVIYIGALNAGVPLSDGLIKFTAGPEKNRLHISTLRWNFAGGVLLADPFDIDLANPEMEIMLQAQTLDLKQLFELAALDGLQATGLVKGSLPLALKEGRLSVHNGWLVAQDQGTIRYTPENPPAFLSQPGNPGMDTLKGALQNFHFNELSLKIDGAAGGQQKVTLQAKGNNPDFQGGFPVNINLNLEGALDSILRQNLSNYKMPDIVRKQIESYEEKHAQ